MKKILILFLDLRYPGRILKRIIMRDTIKRLDRITKWDSDRKNAFIAKVTEDKLTNIF